MARIEVRSEVTGKVWKIEIPVGAVAAADEPVMIIESMKMEIAVVAPCSGTVLRLLCQEGSAVAAGQNLLAICAITSELQP